MEKGLPFLSVGTGNSASMIVAAVDAKHAARTLLDKNKAAARTAMAVVMMSSRERNRLPAMTDSGAMTIQWPSSDATSFSCQTKTCGAGRNANDAKQRSKQAITIRAVFIIVLVSSTHHYRMKRGDGRHSTLRISPQVAARSGPLIA
jgi:hypothetical protein